MATTLLEPDRDQLEIFVEALFRHSGKNGWISMRAFYEGDDNGAPPFRTTAASLAGGLRFIIEVAEDDARRAANNPKPVVFCPPLAIFNNEKHAREAGLLEGVALTTECDVNPQAARITLEQVIGPATLIVRSGGQWTDPATQEAHDKVHLHWRLNHPASGEENLKKLKLARTLATRLVNGDRSNIPICHPIRWPGSWHRKQTPRLCEIVESRPDVEIDLDTTIEALKAFVSDEGSEDDKGDEDKEDNAKQKGQRLDWDDALGKILSGESYHPTLTPLASSFAAHDMSRPLAHKVLRALLINSKPTDAERERRCRVELGKLRETIKSGYEKFQREQQRPVNELFDPWARYSVPEFPLDVLSPMLREFVAAQARVIGSCTSGMAMATLAALSGAASHRFSLKMMQHGNWYVHPRLWVLLVGDPSIKKTPDMNAATSPLEEAQRDLYRKYKEAVRAHKQDGGKDEDKPEPPPRYVVMDTTVQKLAEILSRADRGLLVKRDELTGWIGEMDKYSSSAMRTASDRAFWLQGWDGGPYTVDRIGRGETFIENLSVSVVGGIQPERLIEMKGLTSDGLLQRFLPVIMAKGSFTLDCPINQNPYRKLVNDLIALPAQHLSMTDSAREIVTELRRELYSLQQEVGGISSGFQSFLGKLDGYTGSLAILLHLSEFPNERFVAGKVAENVRRLVCEFIVPHAYAFYSLGETNEALKRLASYVLTSDKDRILASDLTTNVRDLRGLSLYQVNERVSVLVAGGWLDPADRTPVCRAWLVNPAVKVRFAQTKQEETARKRNVVELIRQEAEHRRVDAAKKHSST